LARTFFVPLGDVRNARALADRFDEFFGHVAGVLLALVAVPELDEVPAFALGSSRQSGFAGGERFRPDDDEVAERETGFAVADGVFDDRRRHRFRVFFAERALQVAVLEDLHRRAGFT